MRKNVFELKKYCKKFEIKIIFLNSSMSSTANVMLEYIFYILEIVKNSSYSSVSIGRKPDWKNLF